MRLRKPATRETDGLSAETHVQKSRLVIVVIGVVPEVVQLLTLEFVLDPLAIRCVPNQRKHRSDSLDKHGPLRSIGIVERGLRSTINFELNCKICAPVPEHNNSHRNLAATSRAEIGLASLRSEVYEFRARPRGYTTRQA